MNAQNFFVQTMQYSGADGHTLLHLVMEYLDPHYVIALACTRRAAGSALIADAREWCLRARHLARMAQTLAFFNGMYCMQLNEIDPDYAECHIYERRSIYFANDDPLHKEFPPLMYIRKDNELKILGNDKRRALLRAWAHDGQKIKLPFRHRLMRP